MPGLFTFFKSVAVGAKTGAKYVAFDAGTENLDAANARDDTREATNTRIAEQRRSDRADHIEKVANSTGSILSSPEVFKYPQDVGLEEQKHSVLFYINVRSNSRVGVAVTDALSRGGETAVYYESANNRLSKQQAGEGRANAENSTRVATATNALGGVAAAAAVISATSLMDGSSAFAKAAVTLGTGLAVGGATAILSETNTTYRLLSAIQLHVSAPPQTSYSAEWQNVDLGVAGKLASGGGADLASIIAGTGDMAGYAARQMLAGFAQIPKELAGIDANFAGALDATQKKVANPFKEQLFKSMGFRKFAFNYKFSPKNDTELKSVLSIIQLFKYHMHPEFDDSRLYLKYPSEFNIEYHYENQENKYLSKISSCVLSDMKISYGGADFNTFRGTNGAPSEINIELLFTELETLTNDRIGQGPDSWLDLSKYEGGY